MKVLILSPYPKRIIKIIENHGDDYHLYNDKIKLNFLREKSIDFIISFGYRHIINEEIIKEYPNSIINLHLSFLPFNRGCHPNLWSQIDKTPSGITIHLIDKGIDTGKIIYREELFINPEKNSFQSSYDLLVLKLVSLFEDKWQFLRLEEGKCQQLNGLNNQHMEKDCEDN